MNIWSYGGERKGTDLWRDTEPGKIQLNWNAVQVHTWNIGMFSKLCTVAFDLSEAPLDVCNRSDGRGVYHQTKFDILFLFGLTELKAQVVWEEPDVCCLFFSHELLSIINAKSRGMKNGKLSTLPLP